MKRVLNLNPKCRFYIDSEDWLNIFDGYATIAIDPNETEALRKFLAEGPGAERPEQKILREKLHYLISCNPTGTGSCYPLTDKILALFTDEIHTQAETWGYIPGPKGLRNPETGERLEP